MLTDELSKLIEPDAAKSLVDHEFAVQLSIAISMRRIADLLDGTTLGINVAEAIFNPPR